MSIKNFCKAVHAGDALRAALALQSLDGINDKYMEISYSTPLIYALHFEGAHPIAKMVVCLGADVNVPDANGHTPLHFAQSLDMIKFLVDAGASVNSLSKEGNSALHVYAGDSEVDSEIIRYLVAAGAGLNVQNSQGTTPLHIAIHNEVSLIVKTLLELGADCTIPNVDGETAEFLIHSKRYNLTM